MEHIMNDGLVLVILWCLIGVAVLDSCTDHRDAQRIDRIEQQMNVGETK